MAASAPLLRRVEPEITSAVWNKSRIGILLTAALTVLAVIIHGYHPYAEDGGLYLAGIKKVLHPDLYPQWTAFTIVHLRFSLFAPLVALIVRASHLSLMGVMFAIYIASIWLTLFAAWEISIRCFASIEACCGAVSLLTVLLTVPVAGTSLMLMDPYVSARSISTPCALLALVAVIHIARQARQHTRFSYANPILCCGSLFIAAIVHPLMAAYALGCVLVLAASALSNKWWKLATYIGGSAATIALAAALGWRSPAPEAAYSVVARTRTYWFLDCWHWYEWIGLAAPLLVLAIAWLRAKDTSTRTVQLLAEMCLVAGTLATVVAVLFARAGVSNYAVARLQPLRVFQLIYFITILVVGAALGERILRRSGWRWSGIGVSVGATMMVVQLATFPRSSHIELPWVDGGNEWEQAFGWIRNHTPESAVIALDADYIDAAGEDSQNFRAIAERSALPDYSKDGGVASIAPDLAPAWLAGEKAQEGLDRASDVQRLADLSAFPVDWIVLPAGATTSFVCPYANDAARVCRIPSAQSGRKMP